MVAKGLPASPGAAVGQVVFTAEEAEAWHSQGKSVILVKIKTHKSPNVKPINCEKS